MGDGGPNENVLARQTDRRIDNPTYKNTCTESSGLCVNLRVSGRCPFLPFLGMSAFDAISRSLHQFLPFLPHDVTLQYASLTSTQVTDPHIAAGPGHYNSLTLY